MRALSRMLVGIMLVGILVPVSIVAAPAVEVGREVSIPKHLNDGEEFNVSIRQLLKHGEKLFSAVWTDQEGGGRPLTKGTGAPLTDAQDPLVFPRNFNRLSAPDANSCSGCHNAPFGMPGGGGDIVANVFVLAHRFDFLDFNHYDSIATKAAMDESGKYVTQRDVANSRNTLGMFGAGYVEMLSRQITSDLQAIRDSVPPGGAKQLNSKGISFGVIGRQADGSWDVSRVEGLAAPSLASTGPEVPPSLIVRPFHQSGTVISLRQFTNNAYNHHHGIQTTERFGKDNDPDADDFTNELTRADVTAVTVFQATLPVPGRVIPNDPIVEAAIANGERKFESIGCSTCHIPSLPLDDKGWIFSEPNPNNPAGNLRHGEAPVFRVDLGSIELPSPRLSPKGGVVRVPVYTDFKLHDITSGPNDPNREPIDMNQPMGSPGFFAGNSKFITRKLWGVANEPPYFHHGQYTTLRQAVLAHAGEAQRSAEAYRSLTKYDQDSIIEFLKSLQVLPPGTRYLVVDENGKQKSWPAFD